MELYNWQVAAALRKAEILDQHPLCLDASATGVGKTPMTCQAIKDLGKPWALICPKSVRTSWLSTIKEMNCPEPIASTNMEKLQHRNPLFERPNKWHLPKGAICVVDEIQRGASGAKSKSTLILAWAKQHNIKLCALSATAASNPLQMRLLLYYAGLCDWSLSSYYSFARRFGCFASPHHNGLEFVKGPRAAEYMKQIGDMLSPYMVRITTEDAPGFPECLLESRLFDIDDAYKKKVDQIRLELPPELLEETDNDMVAILRLRQVTERYKVPILKELVLEAVQEGKTPVVFVAFRDTLFALQKELSNLQNIGVIIGAQSDKEREQTLIDSAADKCDCILATVAGGGTGLNLQACKGMRQRVSFISCDWSASNVKQALGRIHRATSAYKAIQTFVMMAGSVEERIHRAILGKLDSIEAFNSVTDADLLGES